MLARLDYLQQRPSIDIGPVFTALSRAFGSAPGLDPDVLRLQLDWVQYRNSFRPPIATRPFRNAVEPSEPAAEIAIDVRRIEACDLDAHLRSALLDLAGPREQDWVYLEDAGPGTESTIWSFNRLYWEHLSLWEATRHRGYATALPGGQSDGTNPEFWRDRISAFVEVLDELSLAGRMPEEVFVLELGVGTGEQALVWLNLFREVSEQRGRDYYDRLHYLMGDRSGDALASARKTASGHSEHVSLLELDATNVLDALSFLRGKVLFIHSCNLYDNLPTDEIVRVERTLYRVLVRAGLHTGRVAAICREHALSAVDFIPAVHQLLRVGPQVFDDVEDGIAFWTDVWHALTLHEEYVRIDDPVAIPLVDDGPITLDEVERDLPAAGRCHLSTAALASFARTLPMLHPRGTLCIQDLFVTQPSQYECAFRGPGKLDGSIVNWLNGPLFAAVGARLGYEIRFEPFTRYRTGSNIVVLTAAPNQGRA